jgi:ATP-binding cassette, subfamily B, bacterial MsbA
MANPSSLSILQYFTRIMLKTSRPSLAKILVSLILLGISQSLFILVSGPFLRSFFTTGGQDVNLKELFPAGVSEAINNLVNIDLAVSLQDAAVYLPLILLIASVFRSFAGYVFQLHQSIVTENLARVYRERLFSSLLEQRYYETSKKTAGEWMSLIMNDVLFLQTKFSDIAKGVVKDGFVIISCLITLAVIHMPTFLVLILCAPVLAWVLGAVGRRISFYAQMWQQNLSRIASSCLELRRRMKFVKGQRGEGREQTIFARLNQNYFESIAQSIFIRSAFAPVLEWFGFFLLVVISAAVTRKLWGDFSDEEAIRFFVALGLVLKPARNLGEQMTNLHEVHGVLLKSFPLVQKYEKAQLPQPGVRVPLALPLSIKHTSCGYSAPIISAKDLRIEPGRSIAVIGPSGAGKSTLIKTLAGILEPLQWNANIPWNDLCGGTGFVSQNPFLFSASIRENLSYGIPKSASLTDDAVWQALEDVGIASHVRGLPGQLDALISNFSGNVSGGQLQRLCIARALLSRSQLLLLDEITSALDVGAEKSLTEHLLASAPRRQRAIVWITHRLRWLEKYDEVWLVENSEIQLRGHHSELLGNDRYKAYVSAETANFAN